MSYVQKRGIGDLSLVANTIQKIEGWFPGSKSFRNNNPGNLRYATPILGATSVDASGFLVFPDYSTGYAALQHQVTLDASRGLSIADAIAKYAPASDGNDPASYAAKIAAASGLSVTDQLSAALGGSAAWGSVPSPSIPDAIPDQSPDMTIAYVGLGLVFAGLVVAAV